MEETKFIVTHRGALKAKYGPAVSRVVKALDRLVAADRERGFVSRVVFLDVARDMAEFGAAPMDGPDDRRGAKRCIDALDSRAQPHYFLIVGGPDVVPLQLLGNSAGLLTFSVHSGDEDENVPSDLPYACDAPFSDDAGDFQGPTRVVGRLPDVPNAKSPAYLVELIDRAAAAQSLPRAEYAAWMALSAQAWEKSTAQTVKGLFGTTRNLEYAPPRRDRWSRQSLASRIHFINCHGGSSDSVFLGEGRAIEGEKGKQTRALSSASLVGKILPGTVVAAECCYGAQVFSPLKRDGAKEAGKLGIALQYLREGACGFFGSTNIAYGPEEAPNDFADVICRVFIERVLAGCSLGRAALEARVAYLKHDPWIDPVKLKTLGQFYLLGDPSFHPFALAHGARRPVRSVAIDPAIEARQRKRRRERARREGRELQEARAVLREDLEAIPAGIQQAIWKQAEDAGMRSKLIRVMSLAAASRMVAQGGASVTARRRDHKVMVLFEKIEALLEGEQPGQQRRKLKQFRALIAQVRSGKIVSLKRVVSR